GSTRPRPDAADRGLARAITAAGAGSARRLHGEHRALGLEQDRLGLAAHDELADGSPSAQPDDDETGVRPLGEVDDHLSGILAVDALRHLEVDARLLELA